MSIRIETELEDRNPGVRNPLRHSHNAASAALEADFAMLVDEWRQSIRPKTTLTSLLSHPAYLSIIRMGLAARDPVVRLILTDLAANPRQWFQALQEITGEDPVPPGAATFEEFRRAWLNWGRDRGLLIVRLARRGSRRTTPA